MRIKVECYAGHRGEQEPRRIHLNDSVVEAAEILDRWLAPDHRYFKLLGSDGALYLVRHDEHEQVWDLMLYDARGGEGGGGRPAGNGRPAADKPV